MKESAPFVLVCIATLLWFIAAIPLPWQNAAIRLGWLGLFFYGLSLVVGK